MRIRRKEDGQVFFQEAQMEDVRIVGEHVCTELVESVRQQDLSRVILWLVHEEKVWVSQKQ